MKNREPIAVIGMGGVFPDAIQPEGALGKRFKGTGFRP